VDHRPSRGTRALGLVVPVLARMLLCPHGAYEQRNTVVIPFVTKAFDAAGQPADPMTR
jgi:hypothetical protein